MAMLSSEKVVSGCFVIWVSKNEVIQESYETEQLGN